MKRLAVFGVGLLLVACSDGDDRANPNNPGEHIWKPQTELIDKAKNIEGMLQDAASAQQDEINRQAE